MQVEYTRTRSEIVLAALATTGAEGLLGDPSGPAAALLRAAAATDPRVEQMIDIATSNPC